jgi:hypothetical protein
MLVRLEIAILKRGGGTLKQNCFIVLQAGKFIPQFWIAFLKFHFLWYTQYSIQMKEEEEILIRNNEERN